MTEKDLEIVAANDGDYSINKLGGGGYKDASNRAKRAISGLGSVVAPMGGAFGSKALRRKLRIGGSYKNASNRAKRAISGLGGLIGPMGGSRGHKNKSSKRSKKSNKTQKSKGGRRRFM